VPQAPLSATLKVAIRDAERLVSMLLLVALGGHSITMVESWECINSMPKKALMREPLLNI